MPLSSHLREARRRAARAMVAAIVALVFGYIAAPQVLDVLRAPIEELAASRDASLNYDSITGAFDLRLKVALYAGIVLSSPVWLYEVFAYLAPGLTGREKKHVFGFLGAAVPLFAAGCAAGALLFPRMVELLVGFADAEDSTLLQASDYVDFVLKIVVATGIAFVLPVLLVALNMLGALPAATIARSWRIVLVAIVVFSAVVTPAADVLSMFLIAVPMALLFAAALAVAWLRERSMRRRERALDEEV
ncbi:Sec-independent protein translocase protein TatC [Microbacterium sp. Bi121]|nr:Sec-independent protein translocase protein TatC [Microbacterium sp. Bi121]